MTALCTWDVFSTLDGYGSYAEGAQWGGYWGKQGPELLAHRATLFDTTQRMVWGATTFRETIVNGDAVHVVARLKAESDLPLRSQASLSLNWALLAAGLVDRLQVTIFPVLTGRTGTSPILRGVGDVDLELLESRTFDGRTQELLYRPTPR